MTSESALDRQPFRPQTMVGKTEQASSLTCGLPAQAERPKVTTPSSDHRSPFSLSVSISLFVPQTFIDTRLEIFLTCGLSAQAGRHELGGLLALLLEQALALLLRAALGLRLALALPRRNLVQLAQPLLLLRALLLVLFNEGNGVGSESASVAEKDG